MDVAFTKLHDDIDASLTTTDSFRRSVRYELSSIVTNLSHVDANVRLNAVHRLLTLIEDCDNAEWIIRRTIAYARIAADTTRPASDGGVSDTSQEDENEEPKTTHELRRYGDATSEVVGDNHLPPFVFHRSLSSAVTLLWNYSKRRSRTNGVYRSAVACIFAKIRRATGEAFFDHFLETYHPLVKRYLDAVNDKDYDYDDDDEYDGYDDTSSGDDTDERAGSGVPSIRLFGPNDVADDNDGGRFANAADDGRLQRRVTFGGEIVKIRTPDSVENDGRQHQDRCRPADVTGACERRNNNGGGDGRPHREQFSIRADITVRVKNKESATNGGGIFDSSGSSCSAGEGDFNATCIANDETLELDNAEVLVRRSTKRTSNIPLPVRPALHTPRHPRLSPTPKQLNVVLEDAQDECYSSVVPCSRENELTVDVVEQEQQIVAEHLSPKEDRVDETDRAIKNSSNEETSLLTMRYGCKTTKNNYNKYNKSIEKQSLTVNQSEDALAEGGYDGGVNLKRSLTREINVPRNTFTISTDRLRPFANVNDALNNSLHQFENHDWRIKIEALLDVISLSKYHPKELRKHIHVYTAVVSKEIKNLRSQVARAACLAARHLFVHSSEMNDRDIEQLSRPLFSRAADTNKFLREDGDAALNSMIENCSLSKCWLVLMKKEINQSPNVLIRAAVARLTAKFVQKYGTKKIMSLNDEKKKRFLDTVVKYTTDGQMEIRNTGKLIVSLLSENETLREYLSKTVPKRIMTAALKM